MVDLIWESTDPSGRIPSDAIRSSPHMSTVNTEKRNDTIIITINSSSGTSLKIVPTVLMNAACLVPRRTRKFISQITIDPPIMDGILFPPLNVPGKK